MKSCHHVVIALHMLKLDDPITQTVIFFVKIQSQTISRLLAASASFVKKTVVIDYNNDRFIKHLASMIVAIPLFSFKKKI